jgi:hypothetical protein
MYQDEIIAEVWKNKNSYAEQYHHSLVKMINNLKIRQQQSERLIIDRRLVTKTH